MKKKRLFNRIGSAVLALVMALALCVSPVATRDTLAAYDTDITADVEIVAKADAPERLEFEEGQECDIASYFTINYAGSEAPSIVAYDWETWYGEGYTPYSELFSVNYSKIEDGKEEAIEGAPTNPGEYKAYVQFAEEYYEAGYCVYDPAVEDDPYRGYFEPSQIESASIDITVKESSVKYEGLELLYGDPDLPNEDAFILLMFGDGFTAEQQQTFYRESKKISDYVMNTSPYDEFTDTIKIYAYGTVSNQSGARADKAETQAQANADTRDTYFGSSFWSGGMQRLLTISDEGMQKVYQLNDQLNEEEGLYADYSVIVVNSDTYGGSGGEVCVASLNSLSTEMMLHELGHTVADLADEYWAGASYAAELANMSKESDPEKVRWSRFIGKNGVGVYKHEQSETEVDWYRPSDNCKMQYLRQSAPFCEVCKEELRKAFCADSDVTKIFFQTYADEFYQSDSGKDMSEYFIIRRGENEITGDQLGDALHLDYYDANGNYMEELPSQEGTYTIKASFAGNDIYDAISMEATYSIGLPDLITLDVESKVYDGEPAEVDYEVDYENDYTVSIHYTGTIPYTNDYEIEYDSDEAPIKPGKYTVAVEAYDSETGEVIARKSKSYQITFKTTSLVNNNTGTYPGAQDWYNNKHIVIVGEGFTAEEQDRFEELAQEYVDYILNTEPFKETQLYFNFTTVETVSDESGLGENSYFKLRCDDNGKIIPENLSAIANPGYNNVSPYYRANIIIVNDKQVKEGAVIKDGNRGYVYAGTDEKSMEYAARELLNYLTGHEEGYVASSEEEIAAQRIELLNALYYTWYGDDYAVVVSNAYKNTFVENGSPIELDDYFQTYILGEEVPKSELDYTLTYYDSEGNKLDEAPSKAGNYYVLGELIPSPDDIYACDNSYSTMWKVTDDQTIDEDGNVYDADGNYIGFVFWDEVQEIVMDGVAYHVPRARGYSSYTIQPSEASGASDNGADASGKNSAKTGDTAPLALYLILLAGAAVAGGTAYSKKRRG